MSSFEELSARALPPLLAAGKLDSYEALLAMEDREMVATIWKVSPCVAVASMHPKGIVYTSGSSGNKATGLVQDTGGYASGVANTMKICFDATPGVDVIFTNAAPSWVTGQTYGLTGPLVTRIGSAHNRSGAQVSLRYAWIWLVRIVLTLHDDYSPMRADEAGAVSRVVVAPSVGRC